MNNITESGSEQEIKRFYICKYKRGNSKMLYESEMRAGSSGVVMFDSQSKGRGFKSRPVQKILKSLYVQIN